MSNQISQPASATSPSASGALSVGKKTSEHLKKKLLVMQLGRRVYGVNAADVTEVCRPLPATALPGGPKWLRGIANFKGEIIPVVDLSVFDPVAAVDEPQKTKFVISSGRAGPKMALVVDRLYEMISEPDEINPAHNGVERSMPGVTGSATHNNFTIFLLDLEHLVSNLRPS